MREVSGQSALTAGQSDISWDMEEKNGRCMKIRIPVRSTRSIRRILMNCMKTDAERKCGLIFTHFEEKWGIVIFGAEEILPYIDEERREAGTEYGAVKCIMKCS